MRINLTFKQISELAQEVTELGTVAFLVKHKAIRVDPDGEWTVLSYDNCYGSTAIYDLVYPNDTPYTFWNEILTQVNSFLYKKEQKQKAEDKSLELTAESEGL